MLQRLVMVFFLTASVATVGVVNARDLSKYSFPEMKHPADNPPTAAKIELGKALFFDPRLSESNWISCATCHNPALGWSDGLPTGIGHKQEVLGRATPTILNTGYQTRQFWDGRVRTLEEQALGPIEAPGEMAQDMESLIEELSTIDGYKPLFEKAFPGVGITKEGIAKSIAAFERTIVSSTSPFDRWVAGDENAVSESVKRGFDIFEDPDKGNCEACHSGYNFTDNGFHNIGVAGDDPGRYAVKPIKSMKGAFKTPTLRNISTTAPYMHDGSQKTLMDVIDFYIRAGDNHDNLDPNMKKLDLTDAEKQDLHAFLLSLTEETDEFSVPNLPSNH